jgi:DNA-binding transcriptional ArsR family regulator
VANTSRFVYPPRWRLSLSGFIHAGLAVLRLNDRDKALDVSVSYDLPLGMAYHKALHSISDPTRRSVLERLRSGPQSVGAIAEGLPVSRPAVSQHLKVLKEAGLVKDRAEGTRRVYYIDPEGLGELRRWLDEFWDDALTSFAKEVRASNSRAKKK